MNVRQIGQLVGGRFGVHLHLPLLRAVFGDSTQTPNIRVLTRKMVCWIPMLQKPGLNVNNANLALHLLRSAAPKPRPPAPKTNPVAPKP
jgi:hypothetical protein